MTWSSSTAEQQSKYKDTLNVTLSRKYQKGSLIHINDDDVFEWILELEQERINIIHYKNIHYRESRTYITGCFKNYTFILYTVTHG